ncbi:MAG: hypothetical protein K5639_04615 [Eubacterium sp.]|nr:hypothetical protein [Eubacterium sp.]
MQEEQKKNGVKNTANNTDKKSGGSKGLKLVQVIFFLLILACGSGALAMGALENKTTSELEKRELAAFPELKKDDILSGKFGDDFSEALADHIYGRDFFVTAKTYAQIALGKREINGIYIDGERLIELYKDEDFDDKQISDNISDLTGFMASTAKAVGPEHVKLMLVPGKNTVYGDSLPWYMPVSNKQEKLAADIVEALKKKLSEVESESDGDDAEAEDDSESVDEEADDLGFDFGDDESDDESDLEDDADDETEEEADDTGEAEAEEEDSEEEDYTALGFNFEEGDPDANGYTEVDEGDEAGDDEEGGGGLSELSGTGNNPVSPEDAEDMVINLKEALLKHKIEYIFYNTDHHWTSLGAKYAFLEYMKDKVVSEESSLVTDDFLGTDYNKIHYYKNKDAINKYSIAEADGATMEIDDSGDVVKKDGIYDESALNSEDKYNYFLSGNYSRITIDTKAKTDKTLLVVKDSFTNSLIPFLCREYKRIVMIDLRYVKSSIFDYLPDGEMPKDVLIVCNEEKFMQDTHQMYLR